MDMNELLARYEARGDERDFVAARPLFEQAIAGADDARVLTGYGYLLESHARNELRQAVALYERAIAIDPADDTPHYQLISVRAGLREAERAVETYERRLAVAPESVREHRFLAQAHLAARSYARALELADAGLTLAQGDAALTAARGEARAGLGDVDGALADWRLALRLDPEDIGALYSSAFLLEREGRLRESAEAWQGIVDWTEARGLTLEAEWPKRELRRLRAAIAEA